MKKDTEGGWEEVRLLSVHQKQLCSFRLPQSCADGLQDYSGAETSLLPSDTQKTLQHPSAMHSSCVCADSGMIRTTLPVHKNTHIM